MMKKRRIFSTGLSVLMTISVLTSAILPGVVLAQNYEEVTESQKIYSPYVERTQSNEDFAEGAYFGDAHVHTSYSADAGMLGTTLGPEEACRFALGEEVLSSTGQRVRLIRPLDFLVVADHAENLGLAPMINESNRDIIANEWGKTAHGLVKVGKGTEAFQMWASTMSKNKDPIDNTKIMRSIWEREIKFAEQYNDPGNFIALIGFEWTSMAPPETPGNLHRNVIFKDGGKMAGQVLPFSAFDSDDPEDLWKYMAPYEEKTGGSVLAIPYSGNLSNGQMFPVERSNGDASDREYAETRRRWEPLAKATQMNGDDLLTTDGYELLASGLAAVWARENTREGIFNAMHKREVYATTGARMTVRLFGGWDYGENDVFKPDAVAIGYRKGVPMGGDLHDVPKSKTAPVFMVGALKDIASGNLDKDGRCRTPVGNMVDEANARYLNKVGDAELRATWTDPDFDPKLPAVYYVRVLEIPTPAWQAYHSKFFGVTMPEDVPRDPPGTGLYLADLVHAVIMDVKHIEKIV